MDGSLAIEANRAALKRIVATLRRQAGFARPWHSEVPHVMPAKARKDHPPLPGAPIPEHS